MSNYGVKGNLFTTQSKLLTTPRNRSLENIAEKGENADYQSFLFFSQCFLPYQGQKSSFNPLPNDKISRQVQIVSISRRQNRCDLKNGNLFWKG